MGRSRFPGTVESVGRQIYVSYRDTQIYFYVTKFGHCKLRYIYSDGNVVSDGQEAGSEFKGEKKKDGTGRVGEEKPRKEGRRRWGEAVGKLIVAGPTLKIGKEGIRARQRWRGGWKISRMEALVLGRRRVKAGDSGYS